MSECTLREKKWYGALMLYTVSQTLLTRTFDRGTFYCMQNFTATTFWSHQMIRFWHWLLINQIYANIAFLEYSSYLLSDRLLTHSFKFLTSQLSWSCLTEVMEATEAIRGSTKISLELGYFCIKEKDLAGSQMSWICLWWYKFKYILLTLLGKASLCSSHI